MSGKAGSSDASKRLEGKVCLVTGSAGGIGLVAVQELLLAGARGVTLIDLRQEALKTAQERLNEALAHLYTPEQIAERTLLQNADVSVESDVFEAVRATMSRYGQLDVAVVNAGLSQAPQSVLFESVEVLDRLYRVNVRGAYITLKFAALAMTGLLPATLEDTKQVNGLGCNSANLSREGTAGKGKSIIIVSSVAGLYGEALLVPYVTTKWASRGMSRSAAQELGSMGIRVNSIHPGPTDTEMFKTAFDTQEKRDVISGKTALKRVANPTEIARAMLFLASDDSSYMTGASLDVHGGQV
ncbi:NAD(P)-binding protein [Acaromyces ingoldii]|uniref:NAD(P)-binding protein n=1 Tax=Acaromyces ingoldii TaxID=215250 RepID=A0A316YXN4_9BASI|nr:NAD(P)-binding protein [Acaromyces ingoldii]PWN92575.1 NAD(P)-binding protein [Acaromyces ingoldii]